MSHYRSNLRDIRFTLYELLGREDVLGSGPWAELDREAVDSMLDAAEKLATDHLATSFSDREHGDVWFDPVEHRVTLPEAFRTSYQRYADAEWWRMDISEELGGIAAPASVRWAMAELALGANPAAFIYAAGWTHAQVLHHLGTPEQKLLAQLMVDRHWGATMVLTEPDAGSAVGSGRTKAIAQADGTWHLEGVKRFITSADHDLSDNIVHFVLARPVDTEGAGGPGTKGLSMFVVPKFHVDLDTGELGERNGVDVTNVEHKMGLRVSATCELTFGDDAPAVGWLVGGVHDGIAQMFHVVEYARMLVGVKAMATLSTGYLNAADYARQRVQGPDLARRGDRSAPDVPIIQHPDVRASLLRQKAYAEGLRALALYTATQQDDRIRAEHAGEPADAARARNDLLLPIVKGFSSERAYELLADSLQVLGGSGYLQDYPIEQYIRDAKIDTVYEGTTAIQGLDFFYRKIVRDDGRAFDGLMDEIHAFCAADPRGDREELSAALAAIRSTLKQLRAWNDASADDRTEAYRVGLNATRFLMMVGELVVGWLLARQAEVAEAALAAGPVAADEAFYRGKVASARFFAENQLPLVVAQAGVVSSTTLAVMDLDDAAF
jgi:alkylation response protein AidB-like acyl-CoA dehydrogenase